MTVPLVPFGVLVCFRSLDVGYFMETGQMADSVTTPDYEKLTIFELEAAARSGTAEALRAHLDQAGKFAALGEKVRGFALAEC